MKKIILFAALVLSVFACQQKKTNTYTINGTVENYPNQTKLFIRVGEALDSTVVLNEKFQFKGSVDEPTKAVIYVKKSRDYCSFWVENTEIEIQTTKGEFFDAIIKAGEVQKTAEILNERLKPIYNNFRKIGELASDREWFDEHIDSLRKVENLLVENLNEINIEFIENYPNSIVSISALDGYKTSWGYPKTKELFELMSEEVKQTKLGKRVASYLNVAADLKIGDVYKDFAQKNTKDELVKVSDKLGKYTLLEFWASWCGPCRSSNPQLVEDYHNFHDKGFEIVGVSLDDKKSRWLKAIENDGLVWENISDLKGWNNEAALIYNVSGIPDNVLLDENGVIIARALRGDQLTAKLKELFQ